MQTHTQVGATPPSDSGALSLPATAGASFTRKHTRWADAMFRSAATNDEQLMGSEIIFGNTLLGRVEGLVRDPLSHRVRRLITSYGMARRRVGVPIEWVIKRSPSRVVLGVGVRSLNDLAEWAIRERPYETW